MFFTGRLLEQVPVDGVFACLFTLLTYPVIPGIIPVGGSLNQRNLTQGILVNQFPGFKFRSRCLPWWPS